METSANIPANSILFDDLCDVLEKLHDLQKTQKKQQIKIKNLKLEQDNILRTFLSNCKLTVAKASGTKDSSLFPILRLLLPAYERERNPYNLKVRKLGELLVKVLAIDKKSNDAIKLLNHKSVSHLADSDFAGVAYFALKNRVVEKLGVLTVGEVNDLLDKIATAEVGNKGPVLDEAFRYALEKLSPKQFKWFLRIILKDLRLSIGSDRILGSFHSDAPSYYKNCNNLFKVCEELDDGAVRPVELGVEIFFAVSPMLSERLDVTELAHHLPSDNTYYVENKFDGERFQVHMDKGVFEYYSRRGHKYSDNFGKTYDSGLLTPFLKDCFAASVTSFILDGEMMGWHKYDQSFRFKGESFDVKKITERSSLRPCFCVFDVLCYNGRVLVGPPGRGGAPLHERLRLLDDMFTDVRGVIHHSKRELVKDRSDILAKLNEAIEKQEEGIVVKDIESYYVPNARNAGWYKIKPEYTESTMADLDVVIIGADEAENKRQGRANSFHVACADRPSPSSPPHRWLCLGRVSTGLTFDQMRTVNAALARNWVLTKQTPPPSTLLFNKKKPDLWILPEHSVVLEVRATELIRSTDYATPFTLRFPRIVKIRDDKPVNDVLTLDEFNQLTNNKGNISKLATKTIDTEQMEVEEVKIRKKRPAKPMPEVAEQFRSKDVGDVEVVSQALLGRKLCVLSDDDDCKRDELVKIVKSHGGAHVANYGHDTWCAVVGRATMITKQAIQSREVDVVSTAWLRSLPASPGPCALRPLDMVSMRKSTRLAFSREFDYYGDSYTQLIDECTLKRCFDKMEDEPDIYLTKQEMVDIDNELFGENNPFSFLRPCSLYFFNSCGVQGMQARMFGATLCDDLRSPALTHVIVHDTTITEDIAELKKDTKAAVVSIDWLERCFMEKKLVPEVKFML